MKVTRVLISAALTTGLLAAANCGDASQIAAPAEEPVVAEGLGTTLNGLLTCAPLPAQTVSKSIGRYGGTILIGPHRLRIPAFALDSTVVITASIASERVARVQFEPHGLQFDRPVELSMSYRHCGLAMTILPMRIAYVTPSLDVIESLRSLPDIFSKRTTAYLHHFSHYAVEFAFSDHVVAWGPTAVSR